MLTVPSTAFIIAFHMIMIELSWCHLPGTSKLVCDYAQGDEWLAALCRGTEHSPRCTSKAITAIEQTMAMEPLSQQERAQLERLRSGAPIVIGGQQVGHFGGPLYTWFKIASIVTAARQQNAVPIFWVEDNDHDISEAQHVSIIGADDTLYPFACPLAQQCPEQTIVAACRVGDTIAEQIATIAATFADLPYTKEVTETLRDCYTVGRHWADAFIALQRRVWSSQGVLFVRSSLLRTLRAMAEFIERELQSPGELSAAVAVQTAALAERGYSPQLSAGQINAFYHVGERRFRIYTEPNGSFRAARQQLHREQMLYLVHHEPERFSPSAALRPIVQDALFAPMTTVLGPAELQYHLQLRHAYQVWGVPQATLTLRHSASIIPARIMRLLERHRDSIGAFFRPPAAFESWAIGMLDNAALLERAVRLQQTLEEQLSGLEQMAQPLDPTLARSIAGTRHSLIERLQKLQHRIQRGLRRLSSEGLARYRRAHVHLFPHNGLQERTIAPIHWMCAIGLERWRDVLFGLTQRTNRVHYIATPDELLDDVGT